MFENKHFSFFKSFERLVFLKEGVENRLVSGVQVYAFAGVWNKIIPTLKQAIFISLIGTINSKINGTLKGVYLPISKLRWILAVANLLAHNNITISY